MIKIIETLNNEKKEVKNFYLLAELKMKLSAAVLLRGEQTLEGKHSVVQMVESSCNYLTAIYRNLFDYHFAYSFEGYYCKLIQSNTQ